MPYPIKDKREKLYMKQKGRCAACNRFCTPFTSTGPGSSPPDLFTADHVIPVNKGGTNKMFNLVGLCRLCNQKKGSSITILRSEDGDSWYKELVQRLKNPRLIICNWKFKPIPRLKINLMV